MRKVFAMMLQRFADLKCNDDTVEDFENSWFISMFGSMEESPFFQRTHNNVLLLQVDDINIKQVDTIEKEEDLMLFTKEQAQQVIDFFKKMGEDFTLVVHCGAGVSRSGAIAEFARTYFNLNYDDFKNNNPHILPNTLIVQKLRECHLESQLQDNK